MNLVQAAHNPAQASANPEQAVIVEDSTDEILIQHAERWKWRNDVAQEDKLNGVFFGQGNDKLFCSITLSIK